MVTTKSFTCLTCDIEFASPAGLAQHVALVHRECMVCGMTFRTEEELDRHTQDAH
ncbi:MAG: C2H2-type zinc finger protein [Haloarculaceae archaeon]